MAKERLELDVVADLNAVDDDGQIHFSILPASVAKIRHQLDHTSADGGRLGRSDEVSLVSNLSVSASWQQKFSSCPTTNGPGDRGLG